MRIVLDTTILVRANESSSGLARELLLRIISDRHVLLLSNEMLYELARVLRYPRLRALYGLSEESIYGYIGFLREISEMVALDTSLAAPIRDVNDLIVVQTAILGEADVLCTTDNDFHEAPIIEFLRHIGVAVHDDTALMRKLRSS